MTDESGSQTERTAEKRKYPLTFQKIGQLLAHRWPEYLIEITVVIIGITISLALSNMQEDASNNKLEQVYLKGLLDDIASDINELNEVIRQTKIVIQSGLILQAQSDSLKHTLEKKEFVDLVRSIAERPNFTSKNATFSALKNSANFQLINDIDLKNLLFDYDQQYQGIKTVELAEVHATVVITGPYVMKYIPLADSKRSENWLKSLNVENILSDIEFVNNIFLRVGNRTELLENYEEALKTAREIEEALKRNLDPI